MKTRIILSAFLLVLAAGCASSSSQSSGPAVEVHVEPIGLGSDILYFPGPLQIQMAVSATNPTNQPITFRSLQMNTIGPGAFSVRSGTVNVNRTIPPGGTGTFTVSVWGRAAGGYLRAETPVNLHGTAYFSDGSSKGFIRMFNEIFQGR